MGYSKPSENPSISLQDSKNTLPIAHMEQEIIETIRYNNITIICGETGSGKSTQLPVFLLQNGFVKNGKIGITQPRRIAAITLAQRVSSELGFTIGKEIGYQVRYDSDNISKENVIKFMTDGILLKEIASDFLLKDYNVIIIDEAHERTINTDILLGLLSRIIPLRAKMAEDLGLNELKLVIMSATLRVSDFTDNKNLFNDCPPVINIDSRQYPVTLHFAKTTNTEKYIDLVVEKTKKIHKNLPPGGILIFLPGKKTYYQ
jgi:HrpA-like helicases